MKLLHDFGNGVEAVYVAIKTIYYLIYLFFALWFMAIFKGGRQKARDTAFEMIDEVSNGPAGKRFTRRLVEIYLGYF